MRTRASLIGLGLALMAMSAAAQTTVTSSGTTATTGNVPYVSASTSTSTTITPSPITVSGGNVGIGTPSPAGTLHLYGSGASTFYIQSGSSSGNAWRLTSDTLGNFWIQNTTLSVNPFHITSGGFTGIGTGASITPQAALHVGGSQSGGEIVRVTNSYPAANNNSAGIMFNLNNDSPALTNIAEVSGVITNTSASAYAGALTFSTSNNAAPAERMRIDNSGNVGIGTQSPLSLLSVGASSQFHVGSTGAVTAPSVTVSGPVSASVFSGSGSGLTGIPYSAITNTPVTGVASVFGRTGPVTAVSGDYNVSQISGAAPASSPVFTGNVGIGTAAPGAQLDIEGSGLISLGNGTDGRNSLYIGANLSADNSWERFILGYGVYWNSATSNYTIQDPVHNQATFSDDNGNFVWTIHTGALTSPQTYAQWHAFDRMVLTPAGNLGIGTTTPGSLLDINGAITATSTNNYSSGYLRLTGNYWNSSAASVSDYWSVRNVLGSGTTPASTLAFIHSGSSGAASISVPNLINTGNETITGGLTVAGSVSFPAASIANSATTATSSNSPSTIVARDASGNFSAGTISATSFNGMFNGNFTSSSAAITGGSINGSAIGATTASTGAFTTLSASSTLGVTGNTTLSALLGIGSAPIAGTVANIASESLSGSPTNGYGLQVNAPSGATNKYSAVFNGGNVGIGTTNPGAQLEVNGNIMMTYNPSNPTSFTFADGTIQTTAYTGVTCGGDYAESVDVTGDRMNYEPGDVLVLDEDNPGKILKSIEAYSTSVSGIYSTKPGTVGRRQTTAKSPDEVPMAVVGIVPAKVSAENGPIKVGDLLVTSSTPGYAMKGTDRNRMLGAVVGKAMAKLDSGKGVIEVLVTLQ